VTTKPESATGLLEFAGVTVASCELRVARKNLETRIPHNKFLMFLPRNGSSPSFDGGFK